MTTKTTKRTFNMILCAMFVALIIVGTFLKVPIPYLPFTLQLLFTTLAGIVLGGRGGFAAVSIYIRGNLVNSE